MGTLLSGLGKTWAAEAGVLAGGGDAVRIDHCSVSLITNVLMALGVAVLLELSSHGSDSRFLAVLKQAYGL